MGHRPDGSTSLALDEVTSTSPSHSQLSTVTGGGSSCLSRAIGGSAQTIEVDLDVRFEALSSDGSDYDFIGLRGSTEHNLTLQVRGGLLELDANIVPLVDGGPEETVTSTGYAVDAAWHHVRWTNQLTGSTAAVTVTVDGKQVAAQTVDALDYGPPRSLRVGDCIAGTSSTPWKVRFDNVVIVTR